MASAILRVIEFGGRPVFRATYLCRQIFLSTERSFHLNPACFDTYQILMPALSPTMEHGTIVKWLKKEGDKLSPGDALCDIQTDKAVISMENEEEGILAKILMPDNSKDVKIGVLIGLMVDEDDDWKNVKVPTNTSNSALSSGGSSSSADKSASAPSDTSSKPMSSAPAGQLKSTKTNTITGPSVRKLLEEYSLNAIDVPASGPQGRLLKGDVLNVIKSNNLQKVEIKPCPVPGVSAPTDSAPSVSAPSSASLPPLTGEEYIDKPNNNIRQVIAKRLTLSKTTIPHSYATVDTNMGSIAKLRKRLAGDGIKVSVNDFIIKAAAIALQRVPLMNAVKQGDKVQMLSTSDISVAVATDDGLITPIVKNAANLNVDQISSKIKDLAQRARDGKLLLEEFQGGSFTISNLGMFGITEFSAVINPPQLAILAIGTSRIDVGEDGKPVTKMNSTISYDASAIDELQASQFLEVYNEILENPNLMVVGSHLSDAHRPSV